MNQLIQKAKDYQVERRRVHALNVELEKLTDPGLIDRILMGDTTCLPVAPAPDKPRPVYNPTPRPVRSIDGILRLAV